MNEQQPPAPGAKVPLWRNPYVIAFAVDDLTVGSATRRARLLGALAPTALGFSLTDDATQMYNQN